MANITPWALLPTPPGLRKPLQIGIILPAGVTFTAHPRNKLWDS